MSGLFKRIFNRNKKGKAPEHTPATPPKDQNRTMTVLTRLRDVSVTADAKQLTLKGTYADRRKEVLDASKTDDYETAEKGLDSLEKDVKKQAADKDIYDAAYAGIPEKITAMPTLAATPPALKDARKAVDDAEKLRVPLVAPATQDYTTAKATATLLKQKVEAFVPEYAKVSKDEKEYWVAYAGVPEKISALPAMSATPPPLKEARKAVDDADTVRANAVKTGSTNYATAKAAIKPITDKIDAFVVVQTKFNTDKKEYETNYTGLATKVTALPAESGLSKAVKKRRTEALAADTKRADLVKAEVQDFAKGKTAALDLKKKLTEFDSAVEVEKKLKADPIDEAELAKMVAKEGGTKALDDMIADLPETTAQKVIKSALKVRFKLDSVVQFEHQKKVPVMKNGVQVVEGGVPKTTDSYDIDGLTEVDGELPDKSLQHIYKVLTMVPDSHTRDNESLKKIIRYTEDRGGAAYGGGEVYIHCGRKDDAPDYKLVDEDELGFPSTMKADVNNPDDKVVYFDFATLHEVGHAVDAANNFMGQNGETADYGGWGKDVTIDTVAKAAATGKFNAAAKFGPNSWEAYIKVKLGGGNGTAPAKPDTITAPNWAAAKKEIDDWCDLISGQQLWWNGGGTKDSVVGDTVYQKAYDTQWVSYKLNARKKGISGYQFRAPGEWFAEIYAAYWSGKIKKGSASCAFLENIGAPKST